MRRKHLRIWQVSPVFAAGSVADVGGWRVCGLPSADVRRVVADCAARRMQTATMRFTDSPRCRRRARSPMSAVDSRRTDTLDGRRTDTLDGRRAGGRMYGVGSSDSDRLCGCGYLRCRRARPTPTGGCTARARPTPTDSADAVVCVVDGLVCGVVRPSASPPTGGGGGCAKIAIPWYPMRSGARNFFTKGGFAT